MENDRAGGNPTATANALRLRRIAVTYRGLYSFLFIVIPGEKDAGIVI